MCVNGVCVCVCVLSTTSSKAVCMEVYILFPSQKVSIFLLYSSCHHGPKERSRINVFLEREYLM